MRWNRWIVRVKITIFLDVWLFDYKFIFHNVKIFQWFRLDVIFWFWRIIHAGYILLDSTKWKSFTVSNIAHTFCQIHRIIGLKYRHKTTKNDTNSIEKFHFFQNHNYSSNLIRKLFHILFSVFTTLSILIFSRFFWFWYFVDFFSHCFFYQSTVLKCEATDIQQLQNKSTYDEDVKFTNAQSCCLFETPPHFWMWSRKKTNTLNYCQRIIFMLLCDLHYSRWLFVNINIRRKYSLKLR